MTRFTRSDWGASPGDPGPGRLDPRQVRGIALHWPAMTRPLRDVEQIKATMRAWQILHMEDRGWSDFAYQEAIDQHGNVYVGRGLRVQSGANGDETTNERYGALLLILAPGEEPTPEMVKAVKRRIRRHRELFPRSREIVGHGDIRPGGTECPGPAVRKLIRSGVLS